MDFSPPRNRSGSRRHLVLEWRHAPQSKLRDAGLAGETIQLAVNEEATARGWDSLTGAAEIRRSIQESTLRAPHVESGNAGLRHTNDPHDSACSIQEVPAHVDRALQEGSATVTGRSNVNGRLVVKLIAHAGDRIDGVVRILADDLIVSALPFHAVIVESRPGCIRRSLNNPRRLKRCRKPPTVN